MKKNVYLISLVFLLCATGITHAGKRVALVIGNGAYTHATELANPANDARAISGALKNLQFEVIEANDLDTGGFSRDARRGLDRRHGREPAEVHQFFELMME